MTAESSTKTQGVLGGYRLIASLGEGGMAQVYLGMTRRSGFTKLLVLKVLRRDLLSEEDLAKSFVEEAKIAARLNHPNVVQTYEAGEEGGNHFLAMEYLEGQALNVIYSKIGRSNVPLGVQLRVLCDLLDGLDYAHNLTDYDGTPLGLVHRDVSPHNVIVTYSGISKLLDFGIARITGMTATQEGVVKGKVGYIAPEQLSGERVDRRADIFAAGVILWEMLAGRRIPEPGESDVAVMSRRMVGTDPKIRTVKPEVTPELAEICDKAMAFEPNDRFATAADMRAAIEAYAQPRGLLPDSRTVATFLTKHFKEQREQLMKRIDEQIKSDAASILALDLDAGETGSGPALGRSRDTGSRLDAGDTDATRTQSGVSRTPNARRTRFYVGGALAVVATGAALLLTSRAPPAASRGVVPIASAGQAAPPPAPPRELAATVDAATPAPATVHVRVRVTPPTASVTIDGAPVPTPADVEIAKDGAQHAVGAQLAGYALQTRSFSATSDQDVVFHLVPITTSGRASVRTKPAASSPAPRRRDLDQDPYQ